MTLIRMTVIVSSRTDICVAVSSRTDLDDDVDVVDVTSYSALDVVEIKTCLSLSSSFSALDVVDINKIKDDSHRRSLG